MAITLDELLGRNTQSAQQDSVERFPSYEDFKARNSVNQYPQANAQQPVRYNFDMAPAQAPRSVESVRNYEASRPYVAPQSSEYQTRDYPFYDNLRQDRAQYQPTQTWIMRNMLNPLKEWSKCLRPLNAKIITIFTISPRKTARD